MPLLNVSVVWENTIAKLRGYKTELKILFISFLLNVILLESLVSSSREFQIFAPWNQILNLPQFFLTLGKEYDDLDANLVSY